MSEARSGTAAARTSVRSPTRRAGRAALLVGAVAMLACGTEGGGPEVSVTVPAGATFREVVDTLSNRGLVGAEAAFRVYSRLRRADHRVRSGRYTFREGDGWSRILDALVAGRVVTVPVTIPEGFTLRQIAGRVASIAGVDPESAAAVLMDPSAHERWNVPGPGLEGYLFPDTYRFAEGTSLDGILEALTERYRAFWTPERRARLEATGLSERELVTLASVVQAEARQGEEMPRIASVYSNRLERGWLLQADPTVLYALGGPRERLLYAAIDSVADHPYNTYSSPGLPPGPIGAPGAQALDAALQPEDTDFMFFVAAPDGHHVFTRTLAEHNRAKAEARRAWDRLAEGRTER